MKFKTDEELFEIGSEAKYGLFASKIKMASFSNSNKFKDVPVKNQPLLMYYANNMRELNFNVRVNEKRRYGWVESEEIVWQQDYGDAYFEQMDKVIEDYFDQGQFIDAYPVPNIDSVLEKSGSSIKFEYFEKAQANWETKDMVSNRCQKYIRSIEECLPETWLEKMNLLQGLVLTILLWLSGSWLYSGVETLLQRVIIPTSENNPGILVYILMMVLSVMVSITAFIWRYLSKILAIACFIYTLWNLKRRSENKKTIKENAEHLHRYIRFRILWYLNSKSGSTTPPEYLLQLEGKLQELARQYTHFYGKKLPH